MITAQTMARVPARLRPNEGRNDAWMLAAAAAIDTVATLMLLAGPPDHDAVTVAAALGLHAGAVLLALGPARAHPSRRWLSVTAAFFVPLAGVAVAMAASMTTGNVGSPRQRPLRSRPRPAAALAEVHRMREALPLWEALASDDHEQRRAALMALSRRNDAEAIALLRRTAAAAEPDLALSAALALDEVSERLERRMLHRKVWSVRNATG